MGTETPPGEGRIVADTAPGLPDGFADELDEDDDDAMVGMVVADRFRIERLIGEGGIGRVWAARQLNLDRKVALKMLHPHLGKRKEMIKRFEREALATSRMNHPGCVTVFDFGTWQGQLYIVMEFIAGEALSDVLQRQKRLAPERVCELGAQLCDVLASAHDLDLLHRDLKPENILLIRDREGREKVKVVDFGLAFILGEEESRLTREGTVAGTPAYMAPEQALNRPLDPRSDIYAVGCVLYELLSGRQPFSAETSFEVLQRQIYEQPQPLSRRVPGLVPDALERLVMQCLSKKPELRPPNARTLAEALRGVLDPARRPRAGSEDVTLTRIERGLATGSAPRPRAHEAPAANDDMGTVLVWRNDATRPFSDTAEASLGAAGLTFEVTDDLPDSLEARVLVVDLIGLERGASRSRLTEALAHVDKPALIALGSEDDFHLMSDALAMGVQDYVNAAALDTLPRRVQRALKRQRSAAAVIP